MTLATLLTRRTAYKSLNIARRWPIMIKLIRTKSTMQNGVRVTTTLIRHVNVQSCLLINSQYKPISLQYCWLSVEQPIRIDWVYKHHWEVPINKKIIPTLTCPIELTTSLYSTFIQANTEHTLMKRWNHDLPNTVKTNNRFIPNLHILGGNEYFRKSDAGNHS